MTTALPRAAAILDAWIDNRFFVSRVDDWLNELRNPGVDWDYRPFTTWYTDQRRSEGRKAAEAALEIYTTKNHLRKNASAFLRTVNGMLALCKVDPDDRHGNKYVTVIDDTKSMKLPGYRPGNPAAQAIAIFNPDVPGCGCPQPKGSYVFGSTGMLGLKAVVLYVDPHNSEHNSLSLIMPSRHKDAPASAYTVAEFKLKGSMQAHKVTPHFYSDGPLRASIGLLSPDKAWDASQRSGRDPDSTFGPGGTDYICTNLADLGPYFEATADKLSSTHTH